MKRKLFMIFLALAVVLGSNGLTRALQVPVVDAATFDDLNQNQIVEAMGAGWNLGNAMEATIDGIPSETAWGNPVITQNMIQAVADAGFKSIRIPVSYLNYIGSAPNYTINQAWLNRVKQVVDYAINSGLYVIINVHGDGFHTVTGGWILPGNSDQTTIKMKFEKVWKQIATTFADYDEHLIFESMNEVGADANYDDNLVKAYYKNINAYNQIFVDTVRSTGGNNAKRWLLIPGWNTTIYTMIGNYGFTVPTDSKSTASGKRIMISAHYYSPWEFCGDESYNVTQWGNNANPGKAASWGGEDFLVSELQSMYNAFVAKGYPVVIGEYGSVDKSQGDATNTSYRAYFAKRFSQVSKQYGIVPVIWDNGYNGNYGFGLFNRNNSSITQPAIINAIMEVYGSPSTTPTVTPLPTISPTPTVIPTVTPTATPTVTPIPTTSSLDVKFIGSTSSSASSIVGKYKLTNNGNSSIALSTVTLRYYFTKDGSQGQAFFCDWSHIGNQNVTGSFVTLNAAKQNADTYLQIGFTSGAGNLAPGESIEVHTRFSKSDWSNYDLTNDYSYKSSGTSYEAWNKVTAYVSGSLAYGIEP
jgi:endoglucanase